MPKQHARSAGQGAASSFRAQQVGAGWVRIDAEILGQSIVQRPHDLQPGEFLTGGEAWSAYRRREIDAAVFGVYATEN
jgi:hypothetical protein